MRHYPTNIKSLAIGLLFSIGIAVISKFLALLLPKMGAATIAIGLGIFIGNTFGNRFNMEWGTKVAESKFLEIAIMLLGFSVTLKTLSQLGLIGVIFILVLMTITIVATYAIGKKLQFNRASCLLMAAGNAVCGSSAIASVSSTVQATREEKGQFITLVNLQGTFMMLTLPFLSMQLFHNQTMPISALLGGTLQSVGQVIAGASFVGNSVVEYATLFKIIRITFLVAVVLVFKRIVNSPTSPSSIKGKTNTILPWYLLAFIVTCSINSFTNLPSFITTSATFLSSWLEISALAAIGLRLNLKSFLQKGKRYLIYAAMVSAIQVSSASMIIYLFWIL